MNLPEEQWIKRLSGLLAYHDELAELAAKLHFLAAMRYGLGTPDFLRAGGGSWGPHSERCVTALMGKWLYSGLDEEVESENRELSLRIYFLIEFMNDHVAFEDQPRWILERGRLKLDEVELRRGEWLERARREIDRHFGERNRCKSNQGSGKRRGRPAL